MSRISLPLLCLALAACAVRSDRQAPMKAREVMVGPYTLAYRIFAGSYKDHGPVFARLAADLQAAGMISPRSIGIYVRDPKTTASKDLLCVCGAGSPGSAESDAGISWPDPDWQHATPDVSAGESCSIPIRSVRRA